MYCVRSIFVSPFQNVVFSPIFIFSNSFKYNYIFPINETVHDWLIGCCIANKNSPRRSAVYMNVHYDYHMNCIGGVIISMLPRVRQIVGSSPDLVKPKTETGICCYAALRRQSKYWLARNQDNVSAWGEMYVGRVLFRWANIIKI